MTPEQIAKKYCKLLHYNEDTIGWRWLHDMASEIRNEALEEAALKVEASPNGYAEQFAGIVRALKHKDGQQ